MASDANRRLLDAIEPAAFALEGPMLEVFPGLLYNTWRNGYLQFREVDGSLLFLSDATGKEILERIPKEEIVSIEGSATNELVFNISLRSPTPSKKTSIHFKVTTTKDARDNWVKGLLSRIPPLPKPSKFIDLSFFSTEGLLDQIYPGYVFNSFRKIYMKPSDQHRELVLFDSIQRDNILEKISFSSIDSISDSPKNEFGFVITLKTDPLHPSKSSPISYYFKVLGNTDERDKWVLSLNRKLSSTSVQRDGGERSPRQLGVE
eukprot:TRINITY_DN7245_c0_g1_i1.p1 TRINITY_DN7245_c0_g1~~TRINITY_DN7245_c0_g1_i1.p1  ORF type:complete len:273 (-),score=6.73 TRINITY_DN7245_c0_g1_i1:40-825(-)